MLRGFAPAVSKRRTYFSLVLILRASHTHTHTHTHTFSRSRWLRMACCAHCTLSSGSIAQRACPSFTACSPSIYAAVPLSSSPSPSFSPAPPPRSPFPSFHRPSSIPTQFTASELNHINRACGGDAAAKVGNLRKLKDALVRFYDLELGVKSRCLEVRTALLVHCLAARFLCVRVCVCLMPTLI